MENKDAISAFYALINRLYSINYSALRLSKQRNSQDIANNFTFKKPMESRVSWIDAKLRDIASLRSQFFYSYNNSNRSNIEYFNIIQEEFERSKEVLKYMHNVWYDKNDSFEEIFDGFLCKSPELAELISLAETQPFVTDNESIFHIVNAYSTYIQNSFYKMIIDSMAEIVEQLEGDVSEYAVPTLYTGIIKNENITTISSEQIANIRKKIDQHFSAMKKIKQQTNPAFLTFQNVALAKYTSADMFISQLEKRVKSSNTDVVNTLTNKIVEGAMDFLTGTKRAEKPIVVNVYVTKQELNYIEYLTKMLDLAMENFTYFAKTEEKQKQ